MFLIKGLKMILEGGVCWVFYAFVVSSFKDNYT